MRHIRITDYRRDPAVRELLALAADPADEAALQHLFEHCAGLQVVVDGGPNEPIRALAAYRVVDEYALCLEYLAVLPGQQRRGLASGLLTAMQDRQRRNLWATTAADALGFYRAMGCVVVEAGQDPRWPDAARYLCTLPYRPLLGSQPTGDPGYEEVGGPLARGAIELSEPQAHWVRDFAAIRAAIARALGPDALAIEHTGSTSVPGLPAKPLIDVALLVPDANDEAAYVPALERAGLVFWHREPGWYAHRMFKPHPGSGLAPGNIHVFSAGSPEFLRMVLFRDHLRAHDADRDAYARTKRQAAARHEAQFGANGLVMDYNRFKEPFILGLHQEIFGG